MMVSEVGRTISGSSSVGLGIDHELAVDGFQPVMGDDRHFLGEAFDVAGLLRDEAHRDEQREVAVLVPGLLDALVERRLDQLPDALAPGLDDHAAAHRTGLGHIRLDRRWPDTSRENSLHG